MIRRLADINNGFPVPTRLGFTQAYFNAGTAFSTLLTFGGQAYAFPNALTSYLTSSNGIAWTSNTPNIFGAPADTTGYFLTKGDSNSVKIVLVGIYSGSGNARPAILQSVDGINYYAVNPPYNVFGHYHRSVRVNGNDWVLVGDSGKICFSSDNASSFTSVTSPTTNQLFDVAYGNGFWLAGGASNTLLKSTDGINWSLVSGFSLPASTGTQVATITFANGVFAINGSMTTSDGINFTTLSDVIGYHMFFANGMWAKMGGFRKTSYTILEATTDLVFRFNSEIPGSSTLALSDCRPWTYFNGRWIYCTSIGGGYIMTSP
jgi:hypothetical protein